jgi:hypothetical protein
MTVEFRRMLEECLIAPKRHIVEYRVGYRPDDRAIELEVDLLGDD